jgi:hypothetical protein
VVSARSDGTVVGRRRTGAYGQAFVDNGDPLEQAGFHGIREETELGLMAAGPRHLMRQDGMWLQPEPLLYLAPDKAITRSPRSLSTYRCGRNTPTVLRDATGMEPVVVEGTTMLAVERLREDTLGTTYDSTTWSSSSGCNGPRAMSGPVKPTMAPSEAARILTEPSSTVSVHVRDSVDMPGTYGAYDPGSDSISIRADVVAAGPDTLAQVLYHEVQHREQQLDRTRASGVAAVPAHVADKALELDTRAETRAQAADSGWQWALGKPPAATPRVAGVPVVNGPEGRPLIVQQSEP